MANFLDESQTMWLDTVNKFMDNEITVEYVRKCDMNRDYPYEAYDKIAKQGWLGILIPEEEGGSGGDIFDYSLMAEGLGKFGFDFACSVLVPTFTAMNIIKFGTPEQKKNSCSRSLTARSVSVSISARCGFRCGEYEDACTPRHQWRLDRQRPETLVQRRGREGHRDRNAGTHQHGRQAQGSVGAADSERYAGHGDQQAADAVAPRDGHDRNLPRRSTRTCRCVARRRGPGWKIITEHLELERCAVAAAYTGNAQQAVATATRYAHDRIQFDHQLYDFQVIRHMLADCQTNVDAARLLCYRAARMAADHVPCSREVSMAKLYGSETLKECALAGMQILGGYANLPEADMERYLRESIQSTIGGGTSQIQRTIIAKSMRQ